MGRKKILRMAPNLSLPQDAVTQTFGFIARKGAGKTYAASKLAEELFAVKAPFVVLDPVGNWYGLRLNATGRGPGLSIPVFGGQHGDLPIGPDTGAVIARLVMDQGIAAVLDVSGFRKAQRKKFVADFAEELFHQAKTIRSPMMVILEEAQVFAPQRVHKGDERMLGAIEDIVRLGRNYGLGSTLISQRPQSVHKDVLNQVECLFVGQLNAKHERDAIDGWILEHDVDLDTKELAKLPVGTMFIWSPQWLQVFGKVRVSAKKTFDASATPKLGRKRKVRDLAQVDLSALEEALEGAIEKAKAEDPKLLRATIRKLEAKVKKLETAKKPAALVERVEVPVPVIDKTIVTLLKQLLDDVTEANKANVQVQRHVERALLHIDGIDVPAGNGAAKLVTAEAPAVVKTPSKSSNGVSEVDSLPRVERRLLRALAQHHPRVLDMSQAAIFAGYSPKTSSVKNGLGALRSKDLIEGPNKALVISEAGLAAVGAFDPLPTGEKLAEEWMGRLGKCDRTMLQVIIAAYPNELSLPEVAEAAGYSPSTSSVKNGLGHLRRLKLIEGMNSGMTANEALIS